MNAQRHALARLSRIPGVRGSMLVSAEDGLIIESDLMIGVPGPASAALIASLFQRARRSLVAAKLGEAGFLQVRAGGGFLLAHAAAAAEDLLLIVIADRAVNVALVRLEIGRVAAEVTA